MIPQEIVLELFAYVAFALNIQAIDVNSLPEVKPTTPMEMAQVMCSEIPEKDKSECFQKTSRTVAAYVPSTNKLYYNAQVLKPGSNLIHRSFLIHEATHFFQGQFVTGSCEELKQREIQAYTVQDKYLQENGLKGNFAGNFVDKFKCNEN